MSYFGNIIKGVKTTAKGLSLTFKHLLDARKNKGNINVFEPKFFEQSTGRVTLEYPFEKLDVPDHGRNQLDCEIDDCIVCDKCAKVCPVDCIDIEAIKSPELIRETSDGSPVRLHAAKFDIDLAKCCFCGLCTTVCPTECLTMNDTYDYSVADIDTLNFAFSNLSEAEAQEKRDYYDVFVKEKAAAKEALRKETEESAPIAKPAARPAFIPKNPAAKPAFVPKKPIMTTEKPAVKPAFVPKNPAAKSDAKPAFVPKKPIMKSKKPAAKPAFVPKNPAAKSDAKPAFVPKKPIMKSEKPAVKPEGEAAGKPVFRPKLKPTPKPKN